MYVHKLRLQSHMNVLMLFEMHAYLCVYIDMCLIDGCYNLNDELMSSNPTDQCTMPIWKRSPVLAAWHLSRLSITRSCEISDSARL